MSRLLPFGEGELLSVRLRPAEFARAVGVSKQSVSRWIRDGKVTLGCDGRMNPNKAMGDLLRNGDPGRIRARLIKAAVADVADLRSEAARAFALQEEVERAGVEVDQVRGELAEAEREYEILEWVLNRFLAKILSLATDQWAATDPENWKTIVSALLTVAWEESDVHRQEQMGKEVEEFLAETLADFCAPEPLAKGERPQERGDCG